MFWWYTLTFVGVIGAVLNSVQIYFIAKQRMFIKPYEQLLLSLGSSDLLTSIAAIIYGCYSLLGKDDEDGKGLKLHMLIATFAFTAINLLAIGIDRFLAIRHPIKHRNWLTKKRMKILIILLWIVLMMFVILGPAIAAIAIDDGEWAEYYFRWIASDWIVWSGIMMTVYYTMIIVISLRRRKKLNRQSMTVEARATKREISLIWTCIIIVFVYTVTAFPYAFYLSVTRRSSRYLAILLLSNLIANPIIYFGKRYRDRRSQISVA